MAAGRRAPPGLGLCRPSGRYDADAEAVDAAEDEQFGDARGDELPPELASKETRLATLRAAKQALEDEAAETAREHETAKAVRKARRQAMRRMWATSPRTTLITALMSGRMR